MFSGDLFEGRAYRVIPAASPVPWLVAADVAPLSVPGAIECVRQGYTQLHGKAPDETSAQGIASVGRLETGWGRYKPFPGSYNWGAVQCKAVQDKSGNCPPNCLPAKDSRPNKDGTSTYYGACFKVYADDTAGAKDLVKNMTSQRPLTWKALATGSAWAIAEAMYREHYYEGFGATEETRIGHYAKGIYNNALEISKRGGGPMLIHSPTKDGGGERPPPPSLVGE